jgi:hypothetical protein
MPTPPPSSLCPGCGLTLPTLDGERDGRYNASLACRELYDQLSAYTLEHADPSFIHQHIVDAYGASHTGPMTKQVMGAFALAGLYLTIEKNYTGKQVQEAHIAMAKTDTAWPRFTAPAKPEQLTASNVQSVLSATAGAKRDAAILQWCRDVWQTWESEHAAVGELVAQTLGA